MANGRAVEAECECGKTIQVYGGRSCEVGEWGTDHVCDPNYVTDYWEVRASNGTTSGKLITVVYAKTSDDVKPAYMRYAYVRKEVKKAGGAAIRRWKSHELIMHRREH